MRCATWATDEQRQMIEAAATIVLNRYKMEKEETALSTQFAESNERYIKTFLAIKMVKGLSERTMKYYQEELFNILQAIDKPVPQIVSNDIRVYLATRKMQSRVSNATLDNELRVLRTFFQTLSANEIIDRDPTKSIDRVKCEKKVKEAFTEIEVEKIRQAAADGLSGWDESIRLRNVALIEVLLSTGARISEVAGIRISQIKGDTAIVLGKGNKERTVYFNARAQLAIENYLKVRTDNFDWLFPGGKIDIGKKTVILEDRHTTSGGLESIVKSIGKRAGVENVHPHRFRRTAATFALRRGMPIEQVAKMLGHEQISTTQIYAKVLDEDVKRNHEKFLV